MLPIPLTEIELEGAADVLTRSFAEDPGVLFVLPEATDRRRLGPGLANAMLRLALRCGKPLTTPHPVRGFALWFPPEAGEPSAVDLSLSGLAAVPERLGSGPWARCKVLIDHLNVWHPQYAPEPHWYLAMLGVDPRWQRQGLGEALMRPVFELADRDSTPCYLEAPTLDNVRYYERRGFRVVAEGAIPESDVRIWMMRREPTRSR